MVYIINMSTVCRASQNQIYLILYYTNHIKFYIHTYNIYKRIYTIQTIPLNSQEVRYFVA